MNTAEQVANETVPLSDPDLANAFARVINDLNQHDGPEGMDDDTAADYISALRENGFTVYKSGQNKKTMKDDPDLLRRADALLRG